MVEYKVKKIGKHYHVYSETYLSEKEIKWDLEFVGSLSDCTAFIYLRKNSISYEE